MDEEPHKLKRRRLNKSHRWTESQTQSLLELVAEDVKADPEAYEKPTAQQFYTKVAERSPLLNTIDWKSMKSKMRYLRHNYISAIEWKNDNGGDVDPIENGDEKCEDVNKTCQYFEILDQIFEGKKLAIPNIVYRRNFEIEDLIEDELKYSDAKENPDENYVNVLSEHEAEQLKSMPIRKLKEPLGTPPSTGRHDSTIAVYIQWSLQEKILQFEVKKFESEIELKKTKQKQDFELAKLKLEKDERIEKYELELKYNQN